MGKHISNTLGRQESTGGTHNKRCYSSPCPARFKNLITMKKAYTRLAFHLSQIMSSPQAKIKLLSSVHNVVFMEVYSLLFSLMPIFTYLIFADKRAVLSTNVTKVKFLLLGFLNKYLLIQSRISKLRLFNAIFYVPLKNTFYY